MRGAKQHGNEFLILLKWFDLVCMYMLLSVGFVVEVCVNPISIYYKHCVHKLYSFRTITQFNFDVWMDAMIVKLLQGLLSTIPYPEYIVYKVPV